VVRGDEDVAVDRRALEKRTQARLGHVAGQHDPGSIVFDDVDHQARGVVRLESGVERRRAHLESMIADANRIARFEQFDRRRRSARRRPKRFDGRLGRLEKLSVQPETSDPKPTN
jgi:hypothetical protein